MRYRTLLRQLDNKRTLLPVLFYTVVEFLQRDVFTQCIFEFAIILVFLKSCLNLFVKYYEKFVAKALSW